MLLAIGPTKLKEVDGLGTVSIANVRDSEFGATPAKWAIEYLRGMGGFLAIELDDLAYAIQRGDVEWVARLVKPSIASLALRGASAPQGKAFRLLAQQSGSLEIAKLFGSEAVT